MTTTTAPLNGLSHVKGDTDQPLHRITIPQMLAQTVARFGDRDALVLPAIGKTLSYGEFANAVDQLAAGLLALGLAKGDRLGIWSPNREEWLLTQFATARIGIILVNINPAYRLSELEYALNKVTCKALVLAERFKTSEYLQMIRTLAPELETAPKGNLNSARLPALKIVIAMTDTPGNGVYAFTEVQALGTPAQRQHLDTITNSLHPDDPINIQFTSGTTGAPKGATLTHYNIANNARFVTGRINFTEQDRLCIPVPLYHCFGMVMGTLGCVAQGAAMVFSGEAFDARETLSAISKTRCTAVYGVPTMFVAMLDEITNGDYDLSSLRTGIMAGALCPEEIMRGVNDRMNMGEVTICYGMTETAPVSFQSFVDDPTDKRCATVGRIHPHLEVKIIDPAGNIVPVGEKGELCTRGYSVMHGYWDDPEKTAEAIDPEGWMHTGDLATLDEQGFCTITGRLKDMIIRGGENIYPAEIETFLRRHPDIHEAQVFGIPHEKFGEEVCVWIIPANTALTKDSVRDFCKGQIAHFKIPAHIRLVDELPLTVTGKPQKFVMRDWMVKHAR
jgi:fatty-acyl-CoA synthase